VEQEGSGPVKKHKVYIGPLSLEQGKGRILKDRLVMKEGPRVIEAGKEQQPKKVL
jgi:hypothetical protein